MKYFKIKFEAPVSVSKKSQLSATDELWQGAFSDKLIVSITDLCKRLIKITSYNNTLTVLRSLIKLNSVEHAIQ